MTRELRCQYALKTQIGQPSTSRSVHVPCRRSTVYQSERSYTVPSVNRLPAAYEVCAKSVDRLPASKGLKLNHAKAICHNLLLQYKQCDWVDSHSKSVQNSADYRNFIAPQIWLAATVSCYFFSTASAITKPL